MKLKTSFFDFAVFKKDLIRFSPAWGLYLIGGLLICLTSLYGTDPMSVAQSLGSTVTLLGWLNFLYGALLALFLFGDLFRSKMCNALHALPVRREAWFVSHVVAAFAMYLVPNLLLMLTLMLSMGSLWYVPLMWLGMAMLIFVFFFGAAVFSVFCSGNAFAAALLYGIINFGAFLVMGMAEEFYLPLLYGLRLDTGGFNKFMPLVQLSESYRFWKVQHLNTCPNYHFVVDEWGYDVRTFYRDCRYSIEHDAQAWVYVAVLAVIGVVLLAVSLLLYRRRKLECAGDFAAISPVKVVFATVGALAAGMIFFLIGRENSNALGWILLVVGIVVGFFVCQMLLQRTIKVFGGKNWIKLGVLLGTLALSVGLTAVDVFGITRVVPDADQVESVTIANHWLSSYEFSRLDDAETDPSRGADPYYGFQKQGILTLRKPEEIREGIAIHQLLIEEGDPGEYYDYGSYRSFTVHYKLKNGTTLTRFYKVNKNGEAYKRLQAFTNRAAFILGFENPDEMLKNIYYLYFSGDPLAKVVENSDFQRKLVEALFADAEGGNWDQNAAIYGYVELETANGYYHLEIPTTAGNTRAWAKEYTAWLQENEENSN